MSGLLFLLDAVMENRYNIMDVQYEKYDTGRRTILKCLLFSPCSPCLVQEAQGIYEIFFGQSKQIIPYPACIPRSGVRRQTMEQTQEMPSFVQTQEAKNISYFAPGVNRNAVRDYILGVRLARDGGEVHEIAVWKDGALRVRLALPPYRLTDRREIHSLSKIFASTAIGFLYDMGLADLQEKMADVFADEITVPLTEEQKTMTLRHVLSMATGHTGCVMEHMLGGDVVNAFFSQPLAFAPGGIQRYNTGASCMLGAFVTKKTGMSLLDFLEWKLFTPLRMGPMRWATCADGHAVAGAGLRAGLDDIMKLGRLYLQNGVWNGKQILSHEWISLATAEQSWNGMHDSNYSNGYGLHWWRCYPDGYRGDGSMGQLCMVFPQQRAVVAVFGYMTEMDAAMKLSRTLLSDLYTSSSRPDVIDQTATNICNVPDVFSGYEPLPVPKTTDPLPLGLYRLHPNAFGWTYLRLETASDGTLLLYFSDQATQQVLRCGAGVWVYNAITAKKFTPKLRGRLRDDETETTQLALCWGTDENDEIEIFARFTSTIYPERWHLCFEKNDVGQTTLTWKFDCTQRAQNCQSLSGVLLYDTTWDQNKE